MAKEFIYRARFNTDQLASLTGLSRGLSASGQGLGYTQAYFKSNTTASPYCIASEVICGRIGQFLGLPVPPFAVAIADDGRPLFASLDFNFTRQTYPPVLPDQCIASLEDLCAGVLAFDILIANEDRHDANLVVDLL